MDTPFKLDDLHRFIVSAKTATYAGNGRKLLSYRQGSHDLQFFDEAWAYHDSYLGDSDFMGEEAVYFEGKVVWGMNYFGRIIKPELITSEQAGRVIKVSLTEMYRHGDFLGGFEWEVGDHLYSDTNQGSVAFFTGKEWVSLYGETVYELVYHGGLIKN